MRKLEYLRLAAAASIMMTWSGQALAGDKPSGVVLGLDMGAGIPVSDFQASANAGGIVAPFVGYRMSSRSFALTPMVRTQFGFFQGKDLDVTFAPGEGPSAGENGKVRRRIHKSDVQSLFAGSGGFRVSMLDPGREIYAGFLGGYYTDMGSGPARGAGPGFTIEAGINMDIAENTSLGVFIRRDEAYMRPSFDPRDRGENLQYLTLGFSLTRLIPAVEEVAPPPPPAPASVAQPKMPPVTKKIVLRGVTFAFDSAELSDDAKPILEEAARSLKEAGKIRVSVEGHTDATGSEDYNLGLSQRRAASVAAYLQGQGIDGERLETAGFGEEKPVAANDTRDGRAQNRRVELRVIEE